ncbi:unnamed protein product [Arctogadus glacialis]
MLFNLTAPLLHVQVEGRGGLCVCSGRALCVSTGCPLTPSQTCPGLEGSGRIFLGVSCFLCVCAPYPPIKPTPTHPTFQCPPSVHAPPPSPSSLSQPACLPALVPVRVTTCLNFCDCGLSVSFVWSAPPIQL